MKPLLSALLFLAALAPVASAQSEGTFAVGLSASSKIGVKDGTAGAVNPSFLWRYGHGRDGFGWQFGLGWYSAELTQPVGQVTTEFGELNVRPILAGYGYTLRLPRSARRHTSADTPGEPDEAMSSPRRRVSITARLLGGYALTKFTLTPTFDEAYRSAFSANAVSTHMSNAFAVRPELSAWFDVSRRVGLFVSGSYTLARPYVTLTTPVGSEERRLNADVVTLTIGTVYSVF